MQIASSLWVNLQTEELQFTVKIVSSLFFPEGKKSLGRSPPQELEVGPRSEPYLLVFPQWSFRRQESWDGPRRVIRNISLKKKGISQSFIDKTNTHLVPPLLYRLILTLDRFIQIPRLLSLALAQAMGNCLYSYSPWYSGINSRTVSRSSFFQI